MSGTRLAPGSLHEIHDVLRTVGMFFKNSDSFKQARKLSGHIKAQQGVSHGPLIEASVGQSV